MWSTNRIHLNTWCGYCWHLLLPSFDAASTHTRIWGALPNHQTYGCMDLWTEKNFQIEKQARTKVCGRAEKWKSLWALLIEQTAWRDKELWSWAAAKLFLFRLLLSNKNKCKGEVPIAIFWTNEKQLSFKDFSLARAINTKFYSINARLVACSQTWLVFGWGEKIKGYQNIKND